MRSLKLIGVVSRVTVFSFSLSDFQFFSLATNWYLPLSPQVSGCETVSQHLKIHRFSDAAFLPVDGLLQLVFQEQEDTVANLSGRCVTFRVNTKVVGITDMAQSLSFHLFVQFIQHDIGPQWT